MKHLICLIIIVHLLSCDRHNSGLNSKSPIEIIENLETSDSNYNGSTAMIVSVDSNFGSYKQFNFKYSFDTICDIQCPELIDLSNYKILCKQRIQIFIRDSLIGDFQYNKLEFDRYNDVYPDVSLGCREIRFLGLQLMRLDSNYFIHVSCFHDDGPLAEYGFFINLKGKLLGDAMYGKVISNTYPTGEYTYYDSLYRKNNFSNVLYKQWFVNRIEIVK